MKALRFLALPLFVVVLLATGRAAAPANMRLFLLVGQSNMAGRGEIEPADKVPHARVFVLTKDLAWVPAVDPLHFDKKSAGVGLGATFGRVLADALPEETIGLIPAAVGGSSLDQWRRDGELYRIAVERARGAMKYGKLAGILWHQGEADTDKTKVATYAERFTAFIGNLRSDLGADVIPVLVGEIGRFGGRGAAINAEIVRLPQRVPHCATVTSEGLIHKGDNLHFDSPSLREFGRRYARVYLEMRK